MTPAELAELVANGDDDAAVAAMLAGAYRVERRGRRLVAVIPTGYSAEQPPRRMADHPHAEPCAYVARCGLAAEGRNADGVTACRWHGAP